MAEVQGQERKFVGVEVSPASMHAVSLAADGTILETRNLPRVAGTDTITQFSAFIGDLRRDFGSFETVGVAVPGLIDRASNRVAFSEHFPEHSEIDLARSLEDAAGVRAVIENDANAAAFGEFIRGAGRGSRNIFYATLGSGVGGAFIFDGEIWRGKAGFAGEFGYVAINSEGMRLEDVASSANIVRRTRSRVRQDNTSSLNSFNEDSVGIREIIAAAELEDDLSKMMLERTGEYVGTAIATVINLLNIDTIVIGGEIMAARHLVLDSVISRAKELSFGPSFASTRIAAAQLGRDAAAIGAALIAGEVDAANTEN